MISRSLVLYTSPLTDYLQALAFGYFETLLRLGDASKIRAELERLKGCSRTMLDEVGYNETIYGDFADETFDMLEKLASNLPNHDGGASLLASFNTMSVWSAITYHFRVCAHSELLSRLLGLC